MILHKGIMVATGELKTSCWWGLPLGSRAEERRETLIFHLFFLLSCLFLIFLIIVFFCNFSNKFRNVLSQRTKQTKIPFL